MTKDEWTTAVLNQVRKISFHAYWTAIARKDDMYRPEEEHLEKESAAWDELHKLLGTEN